MSDDLDIWTPTPPPRTDKVDDLVKWAYDQFSSQAKFVPKTLQIATSNRAPTRPRNGMLAYADGTNWNPGGGAGMYAYVSGAWAKL